MLDSSERNLARTKLLEATLWPYIVL